MDRVLELESQLEALMLQIRVHAHNFNNQIQALKTLSLLVADRLGEDFEGMNRIRRLQSAIDTLTGHVVQLHETGRRDDPPQTMTLADLRDDVLKLLQSKYRGFAPVDVSAAGEWNVVVKLGRQRSRAVWCALLTPAIDAALRVQRRAAIRSINVDGAAGAVISAPGCLTPDETSRFEALQHFAAANGWAVQEQSGAGDPLQIRLLYAPLP